MGSKVRTWRLLGIEQGIDEPNEALRARVQATLGLEGTELRSLRLAKRSVDARRQRGLLRFVCQVDVAVADGRRTTAMRRLAKVGKLKEAPVVGSLELDVVAHPDARVVVVGSGPAGVFAALALARNGVAVDLLERGAPVEQRARHVVPFHRGGPLDPETNLLFGEGGAGTYSDGKLYTRVADDLEVCLLEELVACGAPEDILYDSRAHLGTDRLHRILPKLRAKLEALGVRWHFHTRLEELVVEPGPPRRVRAVRTSAGELPCDALVLAVGHSARDTWQQLAAQGVPFEAKPFQLGIRVEHPQELITAGRYGRGPEAGLLGPASYQLVAKGQQAPGAHSFCMCPGGRMVASVSEEGLLCTNGMSNSRHSSRWANAALVTTFTPDDYAGHGEGPFTGIAFQRHLEQLAYDAGGGGYVAPAQRVPDFLAGRASSGELATSYPFGAVPGRLDTLLPARLIEALRRALPRFERSIEGFAGPDGLLVGVETRSSGPVRIPREPDGRRVAGWSNLLAVGEGAGYAGGIMSAAIDGARSALWWLSGATLPPAHKEQS